jgi:NAD(P)-dependent dehydrogenase (short-subunit alcohol dehydrogenase family)
MNPVEEGGNQFAQLFEKVPAKRIGKPEDMAGAILYLCSQAGVRTQRYCDLMALLYVTKQLIEPAGVRRWQVSVCRWWKDPICQWSMKS